MIQSYLRELGSLGSHWVVVIVVGLAFLALQLGLSLRIYLRARRQERALARLRRDLERGGDGRSEIEGLPESFGWLHWVHAVFPASAAAGNVNFKRDDAMHELDTRLASDPSYLLLQRMGIMAPLLGVVLTVIGFYWLDVDDAAEQSLRSILLAVTPLVSGVGAGAILALVNQGLLHSVGGRIDRVRMSARTWFDAAVWRHVSIESLSASADAVTAIDRFARTVAQSAEQHAVSFGRIDEASASLRRAAAQFQDVVNSLHGEIRGVPQALNVLQEAMAASARALQDLIPMGARAIANLDVSVAAFRSTVDQEFKDAAKQHYRSSRSLAQTVQQAAESSDTLKVGADEMKRSLELLAGAAGQLEAGAARLQRTVEKDVAPSQGSMHDAVASFQRSAGQLSEFVEQGVGPATERLANLEQTLAGIEEAVESIKRFSQSRGDIDRLAATLGRSAEIADALAGLPEQLRLVLEENAARQAELVNSRGRTWLGSRPR